MSPTQIRIARSENKFDDTFNVDTSGIKILAEDDIPYSTWADATHYQASNPYVFSEMMKSLGINYHDFTFVDIGSGKGRTLLLASQYGFQKVVGLEFDRQLHEIALENVNKYTMMTAGASQVECIHADATSWAPATEKTVLYLFNPFGPGPLGALLENVCDSLRSWPAAVTYLVYLHPVHEEVVRQFEVFHRICRSDKLDFTIYGTTPTA